MREIKFRAWDKEDKRWISVNVVDNWKTDLDQYPYLVGEFFPTGEVENERQVFDCKSGKTTFLTLGGKLVDVYPYGDGSHRTFIRDISQRFELMQFTGLKDKNGREIYEGDIIRYFYDPGAFAEYTVMWGKNIAGFFIKCSDKEYHSNFDDLPRQDIEVIGNIYETLELLETERTTDDK